MQGLREDRGAKKAAGHLAMDQEVGGHFGRNASGLGETKNRAEKTPGGGPGVSSIPGVQARIPVNQGRAESS